MSYHAAAASSPVVYRESAVSVPLPFPPGVLPSGFLGASLDLGRHESESQP